jgi:putative ABC transport system permease protein
MFIAIRDLKFAKGRFFLMGFVVTLVAFLVITLSGMSEGLIKANISGLIELPATHIAFEDNGNPSYRQTMVERYMWEGWAEEDAVKAIAPMGHTVFIARADDDTPHEIALWGIEPGSFVEPPVIIGEGWGEVENGVIITGDLVQDGVGIGDELVLDRAQTLLVVVGITEEPRNIGHLPVIYAQLPKWQEATYGPPGGPPPGEKLPDILFDFVSIVALQLEEGADLAAIDDENETKTFDRLGYYAASVGYESEVQTVQMIQSLLVVISALVLGAFFSIWTIQRTREIGLVKALGASNGYLMRDALGQAVFLIALGTALGYAGTLWVENLVEGTEFPFMLPVSAVIGAITTLFVAGLIGAALSIRRITSIDPIIALGQGQ